MYLFFLRRDIIMDTKEIYSELVKAYPYLKGKWKMQNNYLDEKTNFIYNTFKFDDLISQCNRLGLDKNYVIHRWYNFHTSIACENVFCEYGCIHETNKTNKYIDIYHKGIPYDVKLTVYPDAFEKDVDLDIRKGKDKLIRWLYKNQSQQNRKHLANRLFIVCVNSMDDYDESMKLKANFALLESKIKSYIHYYENRPLNELSITDGGKEYEVYSDIIVVRN